MGFQLAPLLTRMAIVSMLACAAVQAQTTTFRLTGVQEDDTLNLRAQPNPDAPIVAKIPADARDIVQAGECKEWCRVRYKTKEGWVDRRFLAEVKTIQPLTRPAAAPKDPEADCNSDDPPRQFAGCTLLIDKKGPSNTDLAIAYSRRSDAHIALSNFDQAVADRKQALDLLPDDAILKLRLSGAYRLRAAVRSKTSKPAALADLAEAIRVEPSDHEARLERSAIYFAERNLDKAIEEVKSSIGAGAEKQAYSDWLGILLQTRAAEHMLKRNFPAAIANYTEAIALQPRNASLLVARGDAHAEKGDERQAIQDYSQAIQLKADYAEAYLRRGGSHHRAGNLLQSISDLNESLRLDDKSVTAFLIRAIVREANAQHDLARTDYAKALLLEPENALAKTGITRASRAKEDESTLKQLGGPASLLQDGDKTPREGEVPPPTRPTAEGVEYAVKQFMPGAQLNLRAEPDPDAEILSKLDVGARGLFALGDVKNYEDQEWIKVQVGGIVGWVNSRYIEKVLGQKSAAKEESEPTAGGGRCGKYHYYKDGECHDARNKRRKQPR